MKIIPKFQRGNSFEQFFTVYQPIDYGDSTSSGSTKSSKKSDDDDKGKLTEKDLMSMLKDMDGLPNEMQAIANDLVGMMRYENLTGISSSGLNTQYISNLYKIKHAKFNKDQYDDAYNRSKETGSLNDIAINPNGTVVVQNAKGEMTALTPEQYVLNRDQYTPVTNSNLLWLRAHNPNYINNNQVFQVVENGIGLDAVHKFIKDRVSTIGTTETSYDSYMTKDIMMGDEVLNKLVAAGPDGYYKVSKELSGTEIQALNSTLKYIYDTLPNNAKTRLKLETKNGTEKEAQNIIMEMLVGKINTKTKDSIQFAGTKEKLEGKEEENKQPATFADAFLKGQGTIQEAILNPGTQDAYRVWGIGVSMTDKSENPIGPLKQVSQIGEGNFGPILDLNHATLGDKHINTIQMEGLLTKTGNAISVDFPVMADGYTPVTDPKIFEAKKEADRQLKDAGIDINNENSIKANYKKINEIYEKNGLEPAYDEEGKLINNWRRFAVIDVYADDNLVGKDVFEDKPLFKEITDDNQINLILDAVKDESFSKKHIYNWFGRYNHIYEGMLWIPVNENYVLSSMGRSTTWNQQKERYEMSQDIANEQNANTRVGHYEN